MHKAIGSYEWSGELICSEVGKITDLQEWTVTAHDIFLAEIGSSGFTSYNTGEGAWQSEDIVNMYEQFPDLMTGELKNHHIHTHHNMSSFFSGTDWSQLNDRAEVSNYNMMLIVNFAGNFIAKVAFKAKCSAGADRTIELSNNEDGFEPFVMGKTTEEEVLVVMTMDVIKEEMDEEPKDWFDERFQVVKDAKKPTVYTAPAQSTHYPQPRTWEQPRSQGRMFEDNTYDNWDANTESVNNDLNIPFVPDRKSVMEMTEEEWLAQNSDDPKITKDLANRLINSVIYNNIDTSDTRSPLEDMSKYNKLNFKQIEEKALEYMMGLVSHIEALFPFTDDEFYVKMLKFIRDNTLSDVPRHNKLASELCRLVRREIKKVDIDIPKQGLIY